MNKKQVAAEVDRITKLLGPAQKDNYSRSGFTLVKTNSDREYNEFKSDMVDKGRKRYE